MISPNSMLLTIYAGTGIFMKVILQSPVKVELICRLITFQYLGRKLFNSKFQRYAFDNIRWLTFYKFDYTVPKCGSKI